MRTEIFVTVRTEIFVTAGKRIAGILRHRLRAVFEAWTDEFKASLEKCGRQHQSGGLNDSHCERHESSRTSRLR
jgi:hypothetical protein